MYQKLFLTFFLILFLTDCAKENEISTKPPDETQSYIIYEEGLDAMNKGEYFFAAQKFSEAENINSFTPTSTNTAGTLRLQDGTKIIGAIQAKENILVWTDNALYTVRNVGQPFVFGVEQVGTNCGLVGKNAAVEVDGIAYWMSSKGFLYYDGTVKTLPCAVEDEVFDNFDTTKGQQVAAGLNSLFTEIITVLTYINLKGRPYCNENGSVSKK